MSDLAEFKAYSAKTKDVLRIITELAAQMTKNELREAEVYIPFLDGDATIRMKR